jgi:NTE family protein
MRTAAAEVLCFERAMYEAEGRTRTVALVLAGAITKGAFEAGVLNVIAERRMVVRRIVATSSGALNAAAFAAGVRARREAAAARELVDAWNSRGGICNLIHPSLRGILSGRGFSDQKALLKLLRRYVRPNTRSDPAPIELQFIMAPLGGITGRIVNEPSTTYMKIFCYGGEYFDSRESLEYVYRAATASAALPLLYTPVEMPEVGPCIDGGLVNNTPIGSALHDSLGTSLDAVLVVTPTPALLTMKHEVFRGPALVAHVIDMIFGEWLYQDLRRSFWMHEALHRVDELGQRKGWGPERIEEVKSALGWEGVRPIPIVPIRPVSPLPGTLFSGFTSASIRRRWIEIGMQRAREVLDRRGWTELRDDG